MSNDRMRAMIEYAAPGKAVIWGEYAVLDGAPALVMAVNRYARTRIEQTGTDWSCEASGFAGSDRLTAAELMSGEIDSSRVAAVAAAAVAAINPATLPDGVRLLTDTSTFYLHGTKFGIGSSAAICTTCYAAISRLLAQPADYQGALTAHRHLQGGSGSGLDVAASWHGGLIRFEKQTVTPFEWPAGLHFRFIWSGSSAKTVKHLAQFHRWRDQDPGIPLKDLSTASEGLFQRPTMSGLRDYTECLKNLDNSAGLGIYSEPHRVLDALANEAQVVYKPCGAGGGDIGIGLSEDPTALQTFAQQASDQNYQTLPLEIAEHGIHRIGP